MKCRIIARQCRFEVGLRRSELAQTEQRVGQKPMSYHNRAGVRLAFSPRQKLLGQLFCRVEFAPRVAVRPFPVQDRKELFGVVQSLAEAAGACIGRAGFFCVIAFNGNKRRPELAKQT